MGLLHVPIPGSSLLASHAYDPESGRLEVRFHNGRTYAAEGVPPAAQAEFLAADSAGRAFNVLKTRYPFTRIEDQENSDASQQ